MITTDRSSDTTADVGKLLLRLVLGLLILVHGISKLRNGPGEVLDAVTKAGLPGAIGYLVYVGEVVAPLMLIVGVWTRAAAAIIAINLVVAVALVHMSMLFSLAKTGGWALELQGIYFGAAVAIVLLGAGKGGAPRDRKSVV